MHVGDGPEFETTSRKHERGQAHHRQQVNRISQEDGQVLADLNLLRLAVFFLQILALFSFLLPFLGFQHHVSQAIPGECQREKSKRREEEGSPPREPVLYAELAIICRN